MDAESEIVGLLDEFRPPQLLPNILCPKFDESKKKWVVPDPRFNGEGAFSAAALKAAPPPVLGINYYTWLLLAIAGGLASSLTHSLVQPIDVNKTKKAMLRDRSRSFVRTSVNMYLEVAPWVLAWQPSTGRGMGGGERGSPLLGREGGWIRGLVDWEPFCKWLAFRHVFSIPISGSAGWAGIVAILSATRLPGTSILLVCSRFVVVPLCTPPLMECFWFEAHQGEVEMLVDLQECRGLRIVPKGKCKNISKRRFLWFFPRGC